jgi:hypothetical protein
VVRNVAYMAALIGARHNPVLAAMKQRLTEKGKRTHPVSAAARMAPIGDEGVRRFRSA